MSFFTHYWRGDTFKHEAQGPVGDMVLTVGNQFTSRDVRPDDTIYVISFMQGVLYVVGSLTVGLIVPEEKARAILGTSNLWEVKDYVIAKKGGSSQKRFDAAISQSDMRKIEFVGSDGSVMPPKRNRQGQIEPQTFRGVREITATTASLLDSYLP